MKPCNGEPAERWLDEYLAGTLAPGDVDQFELHYFDCRICLDRLRALQAVRAQLASSRVTARQDVVGWPHRFRWLGVAAAIVLLASAGLFIWRRDSAPESAKTPQAPAIETQPSAPQPVMLARLADRALPPFQSSVVRGDQDQSAFEQGMQSYTKEDCPGAEAELRKVRASDASANVAHFYAGVCALHLGELDTAAQNLKTVAQTNGAVLQESALYYLAQVALARDDGSQARLLLEHVTSLHGDYENRAGAQLKNLAAAGDEAK